MTIRVAFLRAVNVGKRTAPSARLVETVERLGYADAWTYINSGNVVFDASGSRVALEDELGAVFEKTLGFECTTFVRTAAELHKVVAASPFKMASGDTHLVTLLKDAPTAPKRKALEALSNDFDSLVVDGRDVHWRMHGRSTETRVKTKQWDDIVGHHRSTSRNIKMLGKLVERLDR